MQIQLAFLASTVLFLPVAQVALGAQTPVTNAWQAKVGASGVNGTARISITNGVGSIGLTLVRLRPASTLPVALYKGTCASVGALLFRLTSIKTTSTGAASRTTSLTAAQARLILGATAGSGRIALRVGSSTATRCGAFAKAAVPVYEVVASEGGSFGGEFGSIAYAAAFASALVKKGLTGFTVEAERVVGTPGAPPYYEVERSFSTKAAAQAELAKLYAAGYSGNVETEAPGSP